MFSIFSRSKPRSSSSLEETKTIDTLLFWHTNKSSGMIEPQGIETLCSGLELSHTDVKILMLAWKMGAEKQGYFTLQEWRRGLQELKADTLNKLKKALHVLVPSNFADFYGYAFRFRNGIVFPEASNYDPNLAWPSILDDFVDWMKAK